MSAPLCSGCRATSRARTTLGSASTQCRWRSNGYVGRPTRRRCCPAKSFASSSSTPLTQSRPKVALRCATSEAFPRGGCSVDAIATGVPNPAAPSRKPPKANAIKSACKRGSEVNLPIEFLMISNCPVLTVTRKSAMAQNTIQEMGNRPNAAPLAAALNAVIAGIWYAQMATAKVTVKPERPAIHAGLRRTPSNNSMVKIGMAATSAERPSPCPKRK